MKVKVNDNYRKQRAVSDYKECSLTKGGGAWALRVQHCMILVYERIYLLLFSEIISYRESITIDI